MWNGRPCSRVRVPRVYFFTEALAEFQHVNCMIVRIWEVKRVACYGRAETFTEAVASVASMIATPLRGVGAGGGGGGSSPPNIQIGGGQSPPPNI